MALRQSLSFRAQLERKTRLYHYFILKFNVSDEFFNPKKNNPKLKLWTPIILKFDVSDEFFNPKKTIQSKSFGLLKFNVESKAFALDKKRYFKNVA